MEKMPVHKVWQCANDDSQVAASVRRGDSLSISDKETTFSIPFFYCPYCGAKQEWKPATG
jgi:hypothetical protein